MKITEDEYKSYAKGYTAEIEGTLNDFVNPYPTETYKKCTVTYTIKKFKEFDTVSIRVVLTDPINDTSDGEKSFNLHKSTIYESYCIGKYTTIGLEYWYPMKKEPIQNDVLRKFYDEKSKFIWAQFLKHKNGSTKATPTKQPTKQYFFQFIDE